MLDIKTIFLNPEKNLIHAYFFYDTGRLVT